MQFLFSFTLVLSGSRGFVSQMRVWPALRGSVGRSRVNDFLAFRKGKKQHYTAITKVFKLIYYFSCRQLTSVMHYYRMQDWKKKMKKLCRANESNTEIQTSSPVCDVAYSVIMCCWIKRSHAKWHKIWKKLIKTINDLRDHHLIWSLWSIENDNSNFLTSMLLSEYKHLRNSQKMTPAATGRQPGIKSSQAGIHSAKAVPGITQTMFIVMNVLDYINRGRLLSCE